MTEDGLQGAPAAMTRNCWQGSQHFRVPADDDARDVEGALSVSDPPCPKRVTSFGVEATAVLDICEPPLSIGLPLVAQEKPRPPEIFGTCGPIESS